MSEQRKAQAVAFDIFGTLLDLGSAVGGIASSVGAIAEELGRTWRFKQLEYAWVSSLSGSHVDFRKCTEAGLDYALAAHRLSHDLREELLQAYRELAAYPDAAHLLGALKQRGLAVGYLSNAPLSMLDPALRNAAIDSLFDFKLSIEDAGIFKPARAPYGLIEKRLCLPASLISFVSSNSWDVFGAVQSGLNAIWVKRSDLPDEYGLRDKARIVGSLSEVAKLL